MSPKKPKILVVDDRDRFIRLAHEFLRDYEYATLCELSLSCWNCDHRENCDLTHASDWAETAAALAKHPDVDVVLLDLEFDLPTQRLLPVKHGDPEMTRKLQGIEILRRIRQSRGNLPVVLMTALDDLRFENEAAELEVDEFVTLAGPDAFDARAMGLLVERILARGGKGDPAGDGSDLDFVWGQSRTMARLARDIKSLAKTSLPILLTGETGTGKSFVAKRVLHPATGRPGPFVTVDLAAIPETLAAAELFGSVPGAFSGAISRAGCFERAEGGTLFLDEIGNLKGEVQRMLLVTLQSGYLTRLGDARQRSVDVKLVAATNINLEKAVREGSFRGDLYARLNPSTHLLLPPLRERRSDILALISVFVQKSFAAGGRDRDLVTAYAEAAGIAPPDEVIVKVGDGKAGPKNALTFVIQKKSFSQLRSHSWPGNVRDLELLIANATVFAIADALDGAKMKRAATKTAPRTIPIPAKLIRDLLSATNPERRAESPCVENSFSLSLNPAENLRSTLRDMERQVFRALFDETGGDFKRMAGRLLRGDGAKNERRIRMRFNQLGLRVRQLTKK